MKKRFLVIILGIMIVVPGRAQLTLDECMRLAEENYPLVQRYDLIQQTCDFTIDNLGKGYLPQISVGAQVTLQSDVMTFPSALRQPLEANGYDYKGLSPVQYKVGISVSQTIYDGGNIASAGDVTKAASEVQTRSIDVQIYALRERISSLYFGLLLTDERLRLNEDLQKTLQSNCDKLRAMVDGGVAQISDLNLLKAQLATARQQHISLESTRSGVAEVLSAFIGRPVTGTLEKPVASIPQTFDTARPELTLFDVKLNHNNALRQQLDTSLRPTVSLFAEGYYGYPGMDAFADMFSRNPSLNGIIGVKVNWNIGRFYTRRNDYDKLNTARLEIENDRDVFIFNNRLKITEESVAIDALRRVMTEDDNIINLYTSVREASEAKLTSGVITANDLLQDIMRENQSRIQAQVHEIEWLKAIYDLKFNLNK